MNDSARCLVYIRSAKAFISSGVLADEQSREPLFEDAPVDAGVLHGVDVHIVRDCYSAWVRDHHSVMYSFGRNLPQLLTDAQGISPLRLSARKPTALAVGWERLLSFLFRNIFSDGVLI